uniref:GCR020 n=1 Tax=Schmidtea mediterranea TaxID=79327 RepID=A0A193KUG6_SCHMD|nr:GCR020 [Schmidtea mediterranea]
MNKLVNFTQPVQYEPRFQIWPMTLISLLLIIIIIWTIAGNVLVMVTIVTELNIKNSSNHLIFSLAVTDLFVAVAVMPLSAIKEVSIKWWLGLELCDIWIFTDVLTCTASIFHLVVIAIDRYLSITKLTYNRNRSTVSTTAMITSSWIAAALVSIPSRFYLQRNNTAERITVNYNGTCLINEGNSYTILANFLSFCFPLILMGIVYFKIFIFIKKQTKNRKAIKNSVIGSDALSTTFASDICYSKSTASPFPQSEIWSSIYDDSKIIIDENSFESTVTESLEKTKWVNEECSNFQYADEEDENQSKSNNNLSENVTNKYLYCLDKSSTESFPMSSLYLNPLTMKTYSDIYTTSNLAKTETMSTIEGEIFPLKYQNKDILKSPNSNKSIIKPSTSNSRKLKSPTLSWSPKLTFFPYRQSKPSIKNGFNFVEANYSLLSSISSPLKNHNHSNNEHFQTQISDSLNDNSFASLAVRVKRINQKREYKVVRTLFIITGLFIICWLPFAINNLLRAYVISDPSEINRIMDSIFLWLGYVNSGLNPIIYTIFSTEFQVAFKKILFGSNTSG